MPWGRSSRGLRLLLELVFLSADLRNPHLRCLMEEVVIDPIVSSTEPDHFLEQLTPEDLTRSVGGPGLVQHTRGVVRVGKRHHQLEVRLPQIRQTHLVQGAAGVDPVEDGGWCDQGDVPLLYDQILVGHVHFACGMSRGVDKLGPSRPLDQVVPPKVPDPPGKAQVPVMKVDDGAAAETHRLRPLSGRGHFGNDDSDDECVDEAANDVLYRDDDDGDHAVLGHPPETVADGGLSFQ